MVKLTKYLFLLGLLGLGLSWYHKDRLPDPDFYDAALEQEPRQQATEREPFPVTSGDQTYRILPQFDYELDGMVVSFHHADAWDNIYHQDWEDFINIKDVCVIWGENLASGVYQRMQFDNTSWTCWFQWPDQATGQRFQPRQLSNNHLLSDNPAVSRQIMAANTGDQVHFRGVLAKYENPANGFKRGTSITRTDSGNGACETIYIDEFTIVRKANTGWRGLYHLSLWLCVLSAIAWTGLVMSGRGSRA
jgi:hypothetical protein